MLIYNTHVYIAYICIFLPISQDNLSLLLKEDITMFYTYWSICLFNLYTCDPFNHYVRAL